MSAESGGDIFNEGYWKDFEEHAKQERDPDGRRLPRTQDSGSDLATVNYSRGAGADDSLFFERACLDCPFAGAVQEISINTAITTPPERDVTVAFEEDGRRTGRVTLRLPPGGEYTEVSNLAAASAAALLVWVCADSGGGPLRRSSLFGVDEVSETAVACGAFSRSSGRFQQQIEPRPGILAVTDAESSED